MHASAGVIGGCLLMPEPGGGALFALGGGLLGLYLGGGKLLQIAHSVHERYVHLHDVFAGFLPHGK
jgi:hypothetical protein